MPRSDALTRPLSAKPAGLVLLALVLLFRLPGLVRLEEPSAQAAGLLLAGIAAWAVLAAPLRPLRCLAVCALATFAAPLIGVPSDPMLAVSWCLFFVAARQLSHRPRLAFALAAPPIALLLLVRLEPASGLLGVLLPVAALLAGTLAGRREREALRTQRREISQDLHDGIGRSLALIRARAGTARFLGDGEETGRALARIEADAEAALDELRRTVRTIDPERSAPAGKEGDVPRLETLIEEFRAAGMRVEVSGRPPEGLAAPTRRTLRLVLGEALANVLRHATEPRCRIEFLDRPGRLTVRLDSPAGRAGPVRPGRGLRGIERRLRGHGGRAGWALEDGRFRLRIELRSGR